MEHPEYPGWAIARRARADGYPLLLLERDGRRMVLSEGRHRLIIELLLGAARPHEPWSERRGDVLIESIDHLLHAGFVSGAGWAISGVYYGQLIQPAEFAEWAQDPEFVEELARYRRRAGRELDTPMWHASVSSGSWRHAARYIPQRSIMRLIARERALLEG